MASLSILYIVKNEEDHIAKSLASIQSLATEIIVVDTGSTDKTIQICRQFKNVKIFGHKWQHNFSQVRNYGIKQCACDWIFYIDADEKLLAGDVNKIKAAVNSAGKNVCGLALNIIDCPNDWDTPCGNSFFSKSQIRIFRRINGIIFEGKVGETVAPKVIENGGINQLDVKILHYIWRGKGQQYSDQKIAYYRKLGANIDTLKDFVNPRKLETGTVGIVIPAYNKLSKTKTCVSSICANTSLPYVLCLINNGSVDDTATYMTNILGRPPITFHKNEGVAKAKNAGMVELLKNPEIQYICFLDNDTQVFPGWLEGMLSVMDSDPKIGLLGPLSPTGSGVQNITCKDVPSVQWSLQNRSPDCIFVNSINGFCMMARAEALRVVGVFEESFGIYGHEDLDYCFRMAKAGFEIAVANRVVIEHEGRGTVLGNGIDLNHANIISTNRFAQKWKTLPYNEEPARPRSPLREHFGDKTHKTSIVILTHNRLDMTSQCLNSVIDGTSNYELIIVDNASTDGTKDWIKHRTANAKLIENNKNLGVPIARNMGISQSTGDIVVLMDNDCIVLPGWLDEMYDLIRKGADCVGIEAWQINGDFAASKKCTKENEKFDYLGGACTMFKRSVYEKIGLLDEGFSPAYYEDVDICIRAQKVGFKMAWLHSKKIIHKEHATLIHGQKDFIFSEALTNSHIRFAKKMKGEIKVEHKQLPKVLNKLKIMYLGMKYNYGNESQGLSFEHDNFYPAFQQWNATREMFHFDFVDIGQKHGIDFMSNRLMDSVIQFCPDVLFGVWFEPSKDPKREILRNISASTPTKVISWFCDSHFRYENFDKPWAEFSDFCVTTSTSGYQKYIRDGLSLKAIKSQWGASPKYRKIDGTVQDIDVSFVGQTHGDRRQVIDQIRAAGINVQTFGTGWDKRLNFDEMVDMFNRSKINLNLNNACDTRFKQIKGRNFEVPGCGGFLLTENAENLGDYYKDKSEIVCYSGVPDMIEKIKYYLKNDAERETIAKAGYNRTMAEHTYAKRFDSIFQKAGIL